MTIRIQIFTHATTTAIRAGSFPLDEPLDPAGLTDACAASTLIRQQPDHCLSGPEQRVRQTATALGLDAAITSDLADWNCGEWAGTTLTDLQERDPGGLAAWLTSPDAAPHGGESLDELLSRVGAWLDQLMPDPSLTRSTRVVAVTHPSVARAAVVHGLGAPAASFWRLEIGPLSRIELVGRAGRWGLRTIGRAGRGETGQAGS